MYSADANDENANDNFCDDGCMVGWITMIMVMMVLMRTDDYDDDAYDEDGSGNDYDYW